MGGYNNINIKGTLAQWLEHHIMILKVVIVKVTGSNPVCASIINKLTYKQMKTHIFLWVTSEDTQIVSVESHYMDIDKIKEKILYLISGATKDSLTYIGIVNYSIK